MCNMTCMTYGLQGIFRSNTNHLHKQAVLVKQECPGGNKVQIRYFQYKSHDQGHKVINLCVNWNGFISWVCIPQLKI